jgi:hypothetical protein
MSEWVDIMEDMPPYDTWVETKGGYWIKGEEQIVKDYFSSSMGDWMCQPGDPTHWRHIKPPKAKECPR